MSKRHEVWFFVVLLGVFACFYFGSEPAFALAFENKVHNLTSQLISTVLPLLSILGLVWAAILAFSGSAEAKGKIFVIIGASLVGFLAPVIIEWLKSTTGN